MPLFLKTTLIVFVVLSGAFDLRTRKIPNWLTASGILAGLGLHLSIDGIHGLTRALLGMGLAVLVYIPLYVLKGMGAGDVKLMAGVGAICGPAIWLHVFLVTALIGGAIALVFVMAKSRLKSTLANLLSIVGALTRGVSPSKQDPTLDFRNPRALRLPHGAVIASGSVACLLFGALT
jgi:prepilin peptidase CpaA